VPSPSTSATPSADPSLGRSVDAAILRAGLSRCGVVVARHAASLTRLDAVLGDGDHGDNLVIGFRAVDDLLAGLPAETSPGDILRAVGHRLVAAVGGASGPLYGTACIEAGFVAGDASVLDEPTVAAMLRAAADGLARRGRCRPGDKTILDTLEPAATAFEEVIERGGDLATAWAAAARAGSTGMRGTRDLVARRGLAIRLGERSIGYRDPGAVSCLLLVCALGGR
jgi:dihydroxyacetone kinase-like protein